MPLVKVIEPPGLICGLPYFAAMNAPQKRTLTKPRARSTGITSSGSSCKLSPAVNTKVIERADALEQCAHMPRPPVDELALGAASEHCERLVEPAPCGSMR